jgi:hypothetical protein
MVKSRKQFKGALFMDIIQATKGMRIVFIRDVEYQDIEMQEENPEKQTHKIPKGSRGTIRMVEKDHVIARIDETSSEDPWFKDSFNSLLTITSPELVHTGAISADAVDAF